MQFSTASNGFATKIAFADVYANSVVSAFRVADSAVSAPYARPEFEVESMYQACSTPGNPGNLNANGSGLYVAASGSVEATFSKLPAEWCASAINQSATALPSIIRIGLLNARVLADAAIRNAAATGAGRAPSDIALGQFTTVDNALVNLNDASFAMPQMRHPTARRP